jgi:MFS superfamily sulfate permease-like transporter
MIGLMGFMTGVVLVLVIDQVNQLMKNRGKNR